MTCALTCCADIGRCKRNLRPDRREDPLQCLRSVTEQPGCDRREGDQQWIQREEPVVRDQRSEPAAVVLDVALDDRVGEAEHRECALQRVDPFDETRARRILSHSCSLPSSMTPTLGSAIGFRVGLRRRVESRRLLRQVVRGHRAVGCERQAGDSHDSRKAPVYTPTPSPKRRRAAAHLIRRRQLVDDAFACDARRTAP